MPLERCGENKLFLHSNHVANIPSVYFYIAHTFKCVWHFGQSFLPTYGSQLPIKIDLILPSFQILDWDCKQHIFLSFRFLCALWFSWVLFNRAQINDFNLFNWKLPLVNYCFLLPSIFTQKHLLTELYTLTHNEQFKYIAKISISANYQLDSSTFAGWWG